MEIAINTNSLREYDLEEAVDIITDIGCGNVEISTDGRKHAYKYMQCPSHFDVDLKGLNVVALSGGWCDFSSGDCGSLSGQIELCRVLGTGMIRLFVTNPHKEYLYEDIYEDVVANMKRHALLYPDIMLLFENHGGLTSSGEIAARLLSDVGMKNVGLVYDPTNFYVSGQDPVEALKHIGPFIGHVHAKNYADGHFSSVGDGVVDWRDIISGLRESGFDGFISIEYEGKGDAVRELKGSYEYLTRIMRV